MGNNGTSISSELRNLKTLKDQGVLSTLEYEQAKKKALGINVEPSSMIHPLRAPIKVRKKLLIPFISIILFLVSIGFLAYGPFKIPVLSDFVAVIFNKNSESEATKDQDEDLLTDEDPTKFPEDEPIPNEEINKEEVITTPSPSKTTTRPPAAPTYKCTDQEIAELRDALSKVEGYKEDTENKINEFYFACFDKMILDYPNQTDEWYKSTCQTVVCVDLYPDLCKMPAEFQEGIDKFRADLNECLSDR